MQIQLYPSTLVKTLVLSAALFSGLNTAQAKPTQKSAITHDDILGNWKIQKLKDGRPGTVGVIKKDRKGNYYMRVTKFHDEFGKPMKNARCSSKCPKDFRNRPIVGLPILWSLKPHPKKPGYYTGGYGFDPRKEILIQGKAKLSKNKNTLHFTVNPLGAKFIKKKIVMLRDD